MKATIQLYHSREDDYSDVEPDQEKEVEVFDDPAFVVDAYPTEGNGDVWGEAEDLHNHKYYAIDVEADERVTLMVYTNDSVHAPDWNGPVEGGLIFDPKDDYPPFECELWGQVMMWAKQREEDG